MVLKNDLRYLPMIGHPIGPGGRLTGKNKLANEVMRRIPVNTARSGKQSEFNAKTPIPGTIV